LRGNGDPLLEGLILFFKFSEGEEIELLPYVALDFVAAFVLLIGLGIYIKISISAEKLIVRASI
jgi:hypothetical protein